MLAFPFCSPLHTTLIQSLRGGKPWAWKCNDNRDLGKSPVPSPQRLPSVPEPETRLVSLLCRTSTNTASGTSPCAPLLFSIANELSLVPYLQRLYGKLSSLLFTVLADVQNVWPLSSSEQLSTCLKKALTSSHRFLVSRLKKYNSFNLLSCFIIPLFLLPCFELSSVCLRV